MTWLFDALTSDDDFLSSQPAARVSVHLLITLKFTMSSQDVLKKASTLASYNVLLQVMMMTMMMITDH